MNSYGSRTAPLGPPREPSHRSSPRQASWPGFGNPRAPPQRGQAKRRRARQATGQPRRWRPADPTRSKPNRPPTPVSHRTGQSASRGPYGRRICQPRPVGVIRGGRGAGIGQPVGDRGVRAGRCCESGWLAAVKALDSGSPTAGRIGGKPGTEPSRLGAVPRAVTRFCSAMTSTAALDRPSRSAIAD